MILDHPAWMKEHIDNGPKDYYLLLHDRNYLSFVSRYYKNVRKSFYLFQRLLKRLLRRIVGVLAHKEQKTGGKEPMESVIGMNQCEAFSGIIRQKRHLRRYLCQRPGSGSLFPEGDR